MSEQLPTVADRYPPGRAPIAGSVHEAYVAERLAEVGKWGSGTMADHVRRHARERGDKNAFVEGNFALTWAELDLLSDQLATTFAGAGLRRGERVAVIFPDGPVVHALYLATEKAGLVVVGIGPRAGELEVRHLLTVSGASAIVTTAEHRGVSMVELVTQLRSEGLDLTRHFVVDQYNSDAVLVDGVAAEAVTAEQARVALAGRGLDLGDVYMLNSTSGTTGMPKCVVHNQNRWHFYHGELLKAGSFSADDVFLSLIPAPFGFAQWTAHFSPILLGATTVVMAKFDAGEALKLIEAKKVTVLNCVTTQFIMMLNAPVINEVDLNSLTTMFTGGEAIPYERSAQFEERTGAVVLNFYGSNETGTLSYTTAYDSRDRRLSTGGKVIERMRVRLFDEEGNDVTAQGGPGQAGCRGPATCLGYYGDAHANDTLFSPDGWMLTGDICTIDDEGYLAVVDRKADFIIRGGKNISAAAVEEQVGTHPAVAMVAAVGVPDPVYGERTCAVIVLQPGLTLNLPALITHLSARGVSKEVWPERLEFVAELPRASGGKVAKTVLRQQLSRS